MSYNHRDIPFTFKELKNKINEFSASKWDIDLENPTISTRVWSNAFKSGGSVSLEINGIRSPIVHINVDDNNDVREVKEAWQDLIDQWNESPVESYQQIVGEARESVTEFYRSEIVDYQKKLSQAESGNWN